MSALPVSPTALEFIAPSAWRTVDFLSDLHLQASHPATVQVLQAYLQHTPADALFILGDLFEVWIGDDVLSPQPQPQPQPQNDGLGFEAQCCAALQRAHTQRGLALYFLHGNRDFLASSGFAQASSVTLLPDPTVLQFAAQRYVLSHGDALCLADTEYQRFRQLARSSAWQCDFLAQPLAQRRAQARSIRTQSAHRQQTLSVYAEVDNDAACAWLRAAHAHTLIHGHTHRPAVHILDGLGQAAPAARLERHVLSDWDAHAQPARAEVLRLTEGGLRRVSVLDVSLQT